MSEKNENLTETTNLNPGNIQASPPTAPEAPQATPEAPQATPEAPQATPERKRNPIRKTVDVPPTLPPPPANPTPENLMKYYQENAKIIREIQKFERENKVKIREIKEKADSKARASLEKLFPRIKEVCEKAGLSTGRIVIDLGTGTIAPLTRGRKPGTGGSTGGKSTQDNGPKPRTPSKSEILAFKNFEQIANGVCKGPDGLQLASVAVIDILMAGKVDPESRGFTPNQVQSWKNASNHVHGRKVPSLLIWPRKIEV